MYAAIAAGDFAPAVNGVPERVYVPDSTGSYVTIIDPKTLRVVGRIKTASHELQHIAPSWDLKRLYVENSDINKLTVIDPRTSKVVKTIGGVTDPYNVYFTLDGSKAIVVAEEKRRLDFRDPVTWKLIKSVSVPYAGVDHMDFTADGRYALASTEYAGVLVKVDTVAMAVVAKLDVGGLPIDVRLSPDGSVFYVANQGRHGVSIVDPVAMKEIKFLRTGTGAHGLVVSRDARKMYVTNRRAGSISVIDLAKRKVVGTWHVGGAVDMEQVSPDGRQLWVSDRYNGGVLVIDTATGQLKARLIIGGSPHGLCYFPQPGRFSLGHNGVYR